MTRRLYAWNAAACSLYGRSARKLFLHGISFRLSPSIRTCKKQCKGVNCGHLNFVSDRLTWLRRGRRQQWTKWSCQRHGGTYPKATFHDPHEGRKRHRRIQVWSLWGKDNWLTKRCDKLLLTVDRDNKDGEQIDALHENKRVKLGEVSFSNAVIHPWAVMVVAVNAMAAKGAMPTSWSPNYFAVWAEATSLHRFEQFCEFNRWIFLNYARVTQPNYTA